MPRRKADVLPFRPFAEDAGVQTFADFSIENGTRRIALHGSLDITRDRAGLKRARELKGLFEAIAAALEGEDLPEAVPDEPEVSEPVRNPFA
ncbi:hypothetical protein [Methylobacterium sp. R2-1]|uniref:hypothetical protein n=1 Tax=Methylobacterium sp. R2-1 TaxID=2587064 RepID=UPI00160A3B49|nr:hypothetical protein [Methylobacterium sp. R2-1]MBB2960170.1 hypothetical protein [Methylobacterium sp. R2-1]